MKYLDVRFRLPDRLLHPMQAFIRHGDAVRYEEMLAWRVQPDEGVEYVLFYVEADLDRYREAVDEVASILNYRFAPIDDRSAHVLACERTRPEDRSWRDAFAGRHLVVVPPVRFDDDAAMALTVVGDGGTIQDLLGAVPDAVDVTVNEAGSFDRRGGTPVGALTDRQLDAVDAALRLGYYEVPRDADLADVADALDCAESTASVLLRRAERTLLSGVLDRYGGSAGRTDSTAGTVE